MEYSGLDLSSCKESGGGGQVVITAIMRCLVPKIRRLFKLDEEILASQEELIFKELVNN
jgi:hypothetical protein